MRCLLVHNHYRSAEPSGENIVFEAEAAQLASRGHEVETWSLHSDDIADFGLRDRLALPFRAIWSRSSAAELDEVVDRVAPDVVHVHNVFPLVSPSILARLRRRGIPTVATIHNYRIICAGGSLFRDARPCHDCIGRVQWRGVAHGCYRDSPAATLPIAVGNAISLRSWAGVDRLLALSPAQRSLLMEGGLPADKIIVKPNFVADPGPTGRGPRSGFAYVGRLAEAKGVSVLLEAWRTLRSRGTAPVLTFVGDGPLRDVVASEAAAHDDIRFVGKIARSEVLDLLRSTRCLILPSTWEETFGLTVVEAFAVGTPAIATRHGSFPDIVTHEHDGLLVEPHDAAALADAVSRLEDDETMPERLGSQARSTYLENYTPAVVMQQLEDVYRDVVETRATDGEPSNGAGRFAETGREGR